MTITNTVQETTAQPNNDVSAETLRDLIVKGMLEKKAQEVVVMDLRRVKNAICDFFVIGSGSSDTQIDSIADSIEEEVWKGSQQNPWHQEGRTNREWILVDYVDVIAHIFNKDRRTFYDLEQLWGDAEIKYIADDFTPAKTSR
jgi:ribosome-associated protein